MKTTAAYPTPPTAKNGSDATIAKKAFISGVMNMSWQLAILVIVTVVGGVKLDAALKTTPLFTIAGFVLMMLGMWYIVRRQAGEVQPTITQADIDHARQLREQEKDEDDDA